jgi:hypothetical protein
MGTLILCMVPRAAMHHGPRMALPLRPARPTRLHLGWLRRLLRRLEQL